MHGVCILSKGPHGILDDSGSRGCTTKADKRGKPGVSGFGKGLGEELKVLLRLHLIELTTLAFYGVNFLSLVEIIS